MDNSLVIYHSMVAAPGRTAISDGGFNVGYIRTETMWGLGVGEALDNAHPQGDEVVANSVPLLCDMRMNKLPPDPSEDVASNSLSEAIDRYWARRSKTCLAT